MTTIDEKLKNFGVRNPEELGVKDANMYFLLQHRYSHRMLTFRVRKMTKHSGEVIKYQHMLWIGSIVDALIDLEQYRDEEEYVLINSEKLSIEEFIELNQGNINTF